jgi:nondiscriminating aspartyl-tRNA synthetase
MSRILARDLPSAINQTVTVRGWYSTLRELGRVNFLVLRDRTGLMQIVIEDKQELKKLSGYIPGQCCVLRLSSLHRPKQS